MKSQEKIVNDLINELKTNDPELYDYVNDLKYSLGQYIKPIIVLIWIGTTSKSEKDSMRNASQEGSATTAYGITEDELLKVNFRNKEIYLPHGDNVYEKNNVVKTSRAKGLSKKAGIFNIILYISGQKASSLANEIGDVMFALEENELAIIEHRGQLGYENKASTTYSRNVAAIYKSREDGKRKKASDAYPLYIESGYYYENNGTKL